jgi:hypothetical protein
VPEKFDLLTTDFYLEKLTAARNAKLSTRIIAAMEIEYAAKQLYNTPDIAREMELIYKHDPFAAYTEEDKMVMVSNNGIRKLDYVISCNIESFIKQALLEDEAFYDKPFKAQRDYIQKLAQEILDENDAAKELQQQFNTDPANQYPNKA